MLSNNNITNTNIPNNITQTNSQSNSVSSSSSSHASQSVSGSPSQAGVVSPYGLEKGQVVKGEIIDLKNNEVSVKLDDGQVIRGRLAADVNELSIGSKVTLRVENASSQNLTLKLIPSDSSAYLESTIDHALEAANLSKTGRNKSLVAELLNANMSIDKNTLTSLSKQMLQFPDISLKTLVFLNRNNLPVNTANVTFMENFLNSTGKVLSQLTSLSDSISQALQNGDDTSAKYKLLSLLLPSGDAPAASSSGQAAVAADSKAVLALSGILSQEERNTLVENMKSSNLYTAAPTNMEGILTGTASLSETLNLLGGNSALLTGTDLPAQTAALTSPEAGGLPDGQAAAWQTGLLPEAIQSKFPALNPSILQKLLAAAEGSVNGAVNIPDSVDKLLTPEERLQFLSLLKENLSPKELPDTITRGLAQGDISSTELLAGLKPFLSEISDISKGSAEKIISSREFNRLLSSSLLSQWSLSPEDLEKPSSISAHYESMLKQLNDIRELTEHTPFKDAPALQSQAAHVTDTLNFMNTLNHLFTYLQVPVKLKNQYTDSELYIYSNKKSELDITEGVRVVLHLKMDSLGPLDVAIDLRQNQLKNSFYLENRGIKDLLSSHMEDLEARLENLGYQVKTEFFDRQKENNNPADAARDHLLSFNPGPSVHPMEKKRYHFDIRA